MTTTYRVRGKKPCGTTVNELVQAADDDEARAVARRRTESRGIELTKLFRLSMGAPPVEIALA